MKWAKRMRPSWRAKPLAARLSEYEGTSPIPERCRGTEIDAPNQSVIGEEKSVNEITRLPVVRVGVDIAKLVIQMHAVDAAGRAVVRRTLKRDQVLAWRAKLHRAASWRWRRAAGRTIRAAN